MACRVLGRKLLRAWESVQVELHGQYSLQRLSAFHEYAASASTAHVLAVMLLTPLPCLIAIVLSDSLPLEAPARGLAHSHAFWIRAEFTTFIYSHATVLQIQYYVPKLYIPMLERFAISIPVSVLINFAAYLLMRAIGFPLPFTLTVLIIPWLALFLLFLFLVRGRFLRRNPEALRELLIYSLVMVCQMSMILFYPFFYSAFSRLPTSSQTLFAMMLPIMKLLQKNLICRVLTGKDDIKPEIVIFNVEIFNALFVSCCMQSSNSINTNIVIMAADFSQACAGVYDLNKMLVAVRQLAEKMGMQEGQIIEIAMQILNNNPQIARHDTIRKLVDEPDFAIPVVTVNGNQVAPQPFHQDTNADATQREGIDGESNKVSHARGPIPVKPDLEVENATSDCHHSHRTGGAKMDPATASPTVFHLNPPVDPANSRSASISDKLTHDERLLFVQKVLQILYLIEFLLLIEFTEVMIPVVYCVYLVVLYHLPNRVYYSQINSMDLDTLTRTVFNVFIYAIMELVSFLALYYVLKRKLHISGVHQLTFVLEKQWRMVQSKLVMWLVFMLQSTLQHLGADYTFQFNWLKRDDA